MCIRDRYWLFFAAAEGVTTRNWNSLTGGAARLNVFSPYVLTGLTNGVTYSFTMDGRTDGGPGGPGAPTVTAVPRLAGVSWTAGGSLGSLDMQGIASVSYTHLDVYKRQGVLGIGLFDKVVGVHRRQVKLGGSQVFVHAGQCLEGGLCTLVRDHAVR